MLTIGAGNRQARAATITATSGAAADPVRRAFDVVVASALLVVAVPLILLFAAMLALSLRAWPFFSQTRIGRNGETFRFLKLRTLPPTAPAYADKYEIGRLAIPRCAQLLRATHLDELPQLFLVLTGKMSLVGPRPEMPRLHEAFSGPHRTAREALRPGCAGIWQVSVDNDRLIHEAPAYDLFYAAHASLALDAWILWRTALLAVGGRRVTIDDVPSWALRSVPADDLVLVGTGLTSSLAA
jgi:lipopolysaccharide/colanic/teichoic acid biosynthesis glycosyltransferase